MIKLVDNDAPPAEEEKPVTVGVAAVAYLMEAGIEDVVMGKDDQLIIIHEAEAAVMMGNIANLAEMSFLLQRMLSLLVNASLDAPTGEVK
jgi:hypothetical protein